MAKLQKWLEMVTGTIILVIDWEENDKYFSPKTLKFKNAFLSVPQSSLFHTSLFNISSEGEEKNY